MIEVAGKAVVDAVTSVVVVGGGPCGLITALLLGRLGVSTVLFEKHSGISRHPKAMAVTRRTAEIYRQLGLLEAMQTGGLRLPADHVSVWLRGGLAGELLGVAPFAPEDGRFSPCHPFHCPQPHTEAVLLAAVRAEPMVDCRFGTTVTRVTQDGTLVQVDFRGADGASGCLEASYLVAADGDRSPIREQLGISRQGPGELGRFVSVYFRAPYGERLAGRRALLANVLGEQLFEVFVPVDGDDHWLMHHFLDEGESAADCTPERMAEQVRRASGMPEVAIEVLSVSPWVMTPSLATRWRQGRFLLVGDAAARVSPSGGLGMNNGVQGAHNLAWKLAAVVHGQAPEELLDSYEQERLAASEFTFANSEGNAEEIFAIVGAALAGDWEQASQRIVRSRRAGAGYGQDFGIVYGSHAVQPDGSEELKPLDVVNDYIPPGPARTSSPSCLDHPRGWQGVHAGLLRRRVCGVGCGRGGSGVASDLGPGRGGVGGGP